MHKSDICSMFYCETNHDNHGGQGKRPFTAVIFGLNAHTIDVRESGDIIVRENINWNGRLLFRKIPVKIDTVYGGMDISRNGLLSLENTPMKSLEILLVQIMISKAEVRTKSMFELQM